MGRWLRRMLRARTQAHVQHLAVVPPERAGELVGRVYAQVERDFGMLAPPISLHAPAPGALAAAWTMLRETMLVPGQLRRAVKEAVAVSVSRANSCPYCVEVHSVALYGLAGAHDATAIAEGAASVVDPDLQQVTSWVRESRRGPASAAVPVPPRQLPELIATAVTFHYLNRMVNLFLAESPIPPAVPPAARRAVRRLAGRALRRWSRRVAEPGASLALLPAAPLPDDLAWAAGHPVLGDAFARAAAAIEAAGARSVPAPVRRLVGEALAGWDGEPPGLGSQWLRDAVATVPPGDRPAGRLALLAALAPYQAGAPAVAEFRRYRGDDQRLVEVASWASMAAARRHGGWLWDARQPRNREEAR